MRGNRDKFFGLVLVVFVVFFLTVYSFADVIVVRKGHVENVENNCVKIIDNFGSLWEYNLETGEEFSPEQKVTMIMSNNHTEREIEDDIILKIVVDK